MYVSKKQDFSIECFCLLDHFGKEPLGPWVAALSHQQKKFGRNILSLTYLNNTFSKYIIHAYSQCLEYENHCLVGTNDLPGTIIP